MPPEACIICGKPVSEEEAVRCADCDSPMHRSCIDPEVLTDAEGAPLCPACAALCALEWLDHVLSLYASAIKEPRRSEIIARLRRYLEVLESS